MILFYKKKVFGELCLCGLFVFRGMAMGDKAMLSSGLGGAVVFSIVSDVGRVALFFFFSDVENFKVSSGFD